MTPTARRVLGWIAAAEETRDRFLSPRGRRLAVTLGLFVTFAIITAGRVLGAARLDTFALDLRIYRAAAEAAMGGHDPWAASVNGLTFAGPPPTIIPYLPAAVLPEGVAIAVYGGLTLVAAIAALRAVRVPLWWLLFPPISESLIVLNPDVIVIALLVATPRFAALSVVLKVYAAVPLLLAMRWRALAIGLALCVLSVPWWPAFVAAREQISQSLAAQSYGGASAWGTWLMLPTLLALAALWRRGAEWLAVPAIWPYTQLHYSALALPVAARNALVALLLCFSAPFAAPLATIVYAVWVVTAPRLEAYRLGEAKIEPSPSV